MMRLLHPNFSLISLMLASAVSALPSSMPIQTIATIVSTRPSVPSTTPNPVSKSLSNRINQNMKDASSELHTVGFQGFDFRCPSDDPTFSCKVGNQKCIFAYNPLLKIQGHVGCVNHSSGGKPNGTEFHMINRCISNATSINDSKSDKNTLRCTQPNAKECAKVVFAAYNATLYLCQLTGLTTTISASLGPRSTILTNSRNVTSLIPASVLAQYTQAPTTRTSSIIIMATSTSATPSSTSSSSTSSSPPRKGALIIGAYVAAAIGGLVFILSVAAVIGCFITRRKRRQRIMVHRMNMCARRQECMETPPPPYVQDEVEEREASGGNGESRSNNFVTAADVFRPAPACTARPSPPRGGSRTV